MGHVFFYKSGIDQTYTLYLYYFFNSLPKMRERIWHIYIFMPHSYVSNVPEQYQMHICFRMNEAQFSILLHLHFTCTYKLQSHGRFSGDLEVSCDQYFKKISRHLKRSPLYAILSALLISSCSCSTELEQFGFSWPNKYIKCNTNKYHVAYDIFKKIQHKHTFR